MNRYAALYLTTLAVLMALDFLFLGVLAKGFFVSEVGDMLGEVKPVPAVPSTAGLLVADWLVPGT